MSRSRKDPPGRGRGRPKGSLNKVTNEAKEAILAVFRRLGGVEGMVKWVKSDPANATIFYSKIYPRVLPRPPVEAAPAEAPLPPVKGALVWEKPTFPPFLPPETAIAQIAEALKLGGAQAPPDRTPTVPEAMGPPG